MAASDWDNSRFTYAQVLQGGTGVYYKQDTYLRYSAGVKEMQEKLNKVGYSCGTADGKFGSNTETAVIRFQNAYSLSPDGLAGKATLTKLDSVSNSSTPPSSSMNSTKVNAFITYLKQAVADGWGYVWGASGQVYTAAVADSLFRTFGNADYDEVYYKVTQMNRFGGKRVADCSGLIESYTGINVTAKTYYNTYCSTKGTISSVSSLQKGCLLFRPSDIGHVAVYIGDGKVIHAKGSAYGVVEESITSSSFTYYGIPNFLL